MLEWLKWLFARREMEELERRRVLHMQYRQWLAEFKDVAAALDNLDAEVKGEARCCNWPPCEDGPWRVDGLREVLRRRREAFGSQDGPFQVARLAPPEAIAELRIAIERALAEGVSFEEFKNGFVAWRR